MSVYTTKQIVEKLIGSIQPLGDSSVDGDRFNNLVEMCTLVDYLVGKIDDVNYQNKESHEYSVVKASNYASEFLTKQLGIKK